MERTIERKKNESDMKEKTKVNEEQKVLITVETTDKELIDLIESGKVLKFDEKSFKELSEDIVRRLGHYDARDYIIAKMHHEKIKKQERQKKEGWEKIQIEQARPLRPLGGGAADRLKEMGRKYKKPGVHVAFKRPDEVDECVRLGYKKHETAVKGKDDLAELVVMTIPEERYQEHIAYVEHESTKRVNTSGLKRRKDRVFSNDLERKKEHFDFSTAEDISE